jgi:FKBP-type peptidyl-prolyl cis-trans isomerase FkpA
MNYKYSKIFLFLLVLAIFSCEEDEETIISVPESDRTEQQVIDNDSLVGYLNTHYYNSSEVNDMTNPSINDLMFIELLDGEEVPSDHSLLIDNVEIKTTTHMDVEYMYYVLKIKQGEGEMSPEFTDDIKVNYWGALTDGTVFDQTTTPIVNDLSTFIPGWHRVLPDFNTSDSFESNIDGSVSYSGYGMGAMFIPSGLGYFSTYQDGIPTYSNLIFKFELMQTESNDHDSDNIPSYMEVSDSNQYDLYGFDTDQDSAPDFLDTDDDGDGTITADEIQIETYSDTTLEGLKFTLDELVLLSNQFISSITSSSGTFNANLVTLVDSNDNGVPNYLDPAESDTIE